MRILDKRTDFYDYLAGIYRDPTITFDRTKSFDLTKQDILSAFSIARHYISNAFTNTFLLLQVCNTFWLILIKVTSFDDYNTPKTFEAELLDCWENYSKPRTLCDMNIIEFHFSEGHLIHSYINHHYIVDKIKVKNHIDVLKKAVDTNNFKTRYDILRNTSRLPIFKASGLTPCLDDLTLYLAFEQYFSLEKRSEERTESRGLTNNEKITNHGFDTKKSFRGKPLDKA